MGKKKTILEKTISLIQKRKMEIDEEIYTYEDVSDDLEVISLLADDYENLVNLSEKEFSDFLLKLYKQDEQEIVKTLEASYYLISNNIVLFDKHKYELKVFFERLKEWKKTLESSQERCESLISKSYEYEQLEKELEQAKEEGVIETSLVDKIASVFEMKENEKYDYLISAIKFNLESIDKKNRIALEDEKTIEKDSIKEVINEDDLRDVFEKNGLDFSKINKNYLKILQTKGDLDNIEGVFRAITSNRMNFLLDSKKEKLLVQFLLYSNENTINDVCQLFKENSVSSDFFASYLPVFFASENGELKREKNIRKRKLSETSEYQKEEKNNNLNVVAMHNDFIKNFNYMKNNFQIDSKKLLEREVRLLTLSHELLLRRIEELELYGYDIHDSKFPLSTLTSSNIMEHTDRFIELGEEQYIKRFASKLTYNCKDIAERIYAYQYQGLDYYSGKYYGTIKMEVTDLKSSCAIPEYAIKQIVPTDVDDLLYGDKYKQIIDFYPARKISDETLREPIIMDLDEKYKVNESTYKFDDILISRKKVLRNYELLKTTPLLSPEEKDIQRMLLVSTINNSLLNSSQIEFIDRKINGVFNKGGRDGVSKS